MRGHARRDRAGLPLARHPHHVLLVVSLIYVASIFLERKSLGLYWWEMGRKVQVGGKLLQLGAVDVGKEGMSEYGGGNLLLKSFCDFFRKIHTWCSFSNNNKIF